MLMRDWAKFSGLTAFFAAPLVIALSWALSTSPPIYNDCTKAYYYKGVTSGDHSLADDESLKRAPITGQQKTADSKKNEAYRECKKLEAEVGLTFYTQRLVWAGVGTIVVLLLQSLALAWTAYLTQGTLRLARQEFIAAHRPLITPYGFDIQFPEGEAAQVHFRYVNKGESTAFVTGIGTKIVITETQKLEAGIDHIHQTIEPPIEVPVGMHGFRITPEKVDPLPIIFSDEVGVQHPRVVCVGYIMYRDANDFRRQTGFCRVYDSATHRWVKMDDEEYEYIY